MDLQSQAQCFVWRVVPQCEFEYLSLLLLIKLAYSTTKYQCTPLKAAELAVHRTPVQRRVVGGRGGRGCGGQVPPVRLLVSVEEAVSLTVSWGSFLTF